MKIKLLSGPLWKLHGLYTSLFFKLFATRSTYGSMGMCVNEKQAKTMAKYNIPLAFFLLFNDGMMPECKDPGFLAWKRRHDGH